MWCSTVHGYLWGLQWMNVPFISLITWPNVSSGYRIQTLMNYFVRIGICIWGPVNFTLKHWPSHHVQQVKKHKQYSDPYLIMIPSDSHIKFAFIWYENRHGVYFRQLFRCIFQPRIGSWGLSACLIYIAVKISVIKLAYLALLNPKTACDSYHTAKLCCTHWNRVVECTRMLRRVLFHWLPRFFMSLIEGYL